MVMLSLGSGFKDRCGLARSPAVHLLLCGRGVGDPWSKEEAGQV